MYTCIFCKRYLKECYNIFVASEETDNVAPHLDILNFFGNCGLKLLDEQYICHTCLFLIRMLKYIREALEAVLTCDKGLNHLITSFEKFKMLLQAVDYSDKEEDEDILVDSEYDFPDGSSIYASDSVKHSDEFLEILCSDDVHSDTYSNFSRSPTPTSQEVQQVFSRKRKRKRRGTHWTHRKRSYRASAQSRPYSSASKASGNSRKSRTKSRASNASGNKSPPNSQLKYENGFLLKTTRSVCSSQNRNLARMVELENSEYPCLINVCFKRHKSFDELLEHTRRDHNLHKEDLTEEIYNNQLKLHEERIREKERTKRKFSLSSHCVYKEEDKYPCLIDQCFQKFYNFNNYIHHKIDGHNLFAKYRCRECKSLKFTSAEDFIKHNKMRHSYSINCLVCSEKMDNIYDLQQHLEKHRYICLACKYCDKSYLDYYSLLEHTKIHNSEKTEKIQKRPKGSILEMYYYHSDKNKTNQTGSKLDFVNIRIQKHQKTNEELEEEDFNRYIFSRRVSDESVNSICCTPFSEHSNDVDLDGTVFNNEDFEVIEQELNHENEFNLNTLLEDISQQHFEDNIVVVTESNNFEHNSNQVEEINPDENVIVKDFEEIKEIIGTASENVIINKEIDFNQENIVSQDSEEPSKFVEEVIEERIDDVGEELQLDEQMLDAHEINEEDTADLVLEGFNEDVEKDENTVEFLENKIVVDDEDHCEEVIVEGYHVTGDAITNVCYDSEEIVMSVPIENKSQEYVNINTEEVIDSEECGQEVESVEAKTEKLEIVNDFQEKEIVEKSHKKIDYKLIEECEKSMVMVKKKRPGRPAKKKKKIKGGLLDNLSQTIYDVSKGITREPKKESNLYDLFIGNRNKNKVSPKESPNKQNLYDTFIRRNSNDIESKQRKKNIGNKNKYSTQTRSPTKQLKLPDKVDFPAATETLEPIVKIEDVLVLKPLHKKTAELNTAETITKEDDESNIKMEENTVNVPSIVEEVYVEAVDPNALYNSPTHTAQETSTADISSNRRPRRISNLAKSVNNDRVLQFIEAIEKSRLEKLTEKPSDEVPKKKVEIPEIVKSPVKVVEQKLNNSIDSVIEQVKSRITSPTRKNKRKPDKTSKLCVEDDSVVKSRTKRLGMSNAVKRVVEKNYGQEKSKKNLAEDLKSINNSLYTTSAYKHVKKKVKK